MMDKPPSFLQRLCCVAAVIVLGVTAVCPVHAASVKAEPVTLQLKWHHQFQFAGYYAAQEKGYFRDAGLDVRIVEAQPGMDPYREVLDGRAQYGVGTSDLILAFATHEPVVALAPIFQHSPLALIALKKSGITTVHDFAGKRVMIEEQSAEILAYLKSEGITPDKFTLLAHSFDTSDLLAGKVDAISAYVTDEPFTLVEAGEEYSVFSPRASGLDFYGDTLFTTKDELKAHPERVQAFRQAALKGWQYAMEHPEEMTDVIIAWYNSTHSRTQLLFEAEQMQKLVNHEVIEIGYQNPRRWQNIADVYAELGLMPRVTSLDEFIYTGQRANNLTWLSQVTGGVLAISAVILAALWWYYRLSRQLTREKRESEKARELLAERTVELERANAALSAEVVERKRAEEKAEKEQALAKTIIDSIPGTFYMLDENGCYVRWSAYQRDEIVGKPENQMLGVAAMDTIYPDDRPLIASRIARVLMDGEEEVVEGRVLLRGGPAFRWLLMTGRRMLIEGHPYLIGTGVDITERKQMEDALRESEEKFRFMTENASDVIWHLDRNYRFTYISPADDRMRGFKQEEVIGQTVWSLLKPEGIEHVKQVNAKRLVDERNGIKTGTIRYELEQIRKDGSWVWTEETVTAHHGQNGELIGYHGVTRDISERKQIEAALAIAKDAAETANRAKSVFLANMSHELRTPLNAILGFSELMARDPNLSPAQQENLTIINRSGEHLLELINDVLDMAKIEAGRVTLQEHDFDLHRLLNDLGELFRLRASVKGLDLHIQQAPTVPRWIHADEGKLRQVLINLLGNAVKFTTTGSVELSVWLIAAPESERLAFAVRDTGPGIPAADIDVIFEPFVQSLSRRMPLEGTGLGLPISRQFARLMGGELTVVSAGVPGQGSLFQLEIPVRQAETAALSPTPDVARPRAIGLQPGQPVYRLLVVDDRADSRKLLADLLTQLGFAVRTAENGAQAVEAWEAWQPHLIWMDMRMPVMNGHDATQHIKATLQGQATIVIALTASAFEDQRSLALMEGCDDFVRKPFREAEIVDRLVKHLGVRMIYAKTPPAQPLTGAPRQPPEPFAALNFAALPATWLDQVQQAAVAADAAGVLRLAAIVESAQPAAAMALREWADMYDYDAILGAVVEAGNRHGASLRPPSG